MLLSTPNKGPNHFWPLYAKRFPSYGWSHALQADKLYPMDGSERKPMKWAKSHWHRGQSYDQAFFDEAAEIPEGERWTVDVPDES